MILDAGVLVSVDRRDRAAGQFTRTTDEDDEDLHTSEAVVAQVWRDGARQAVLAAFLKTVEIHPLDDGRAVGQLLRDSGTSDVVDAHLGLLAQRLDDDILTGDVDGLTRVVAALPHPVGVLPWPPPPRNR
jgi:hypothetical protein